MNETPSTISQGLPGVPDLRTADVAQHGRQLLARIIPAGSVCALIDFPDYSNVGDSAIWVGQRMFLRDLGVRVRYVCTTQTFSEAVLRRVMPRGTVLIQGGGNFGTLWWRQHALKETVLERLRDYPVVQLPQSIHFENDTALERTRELVARHPAFTLFVRDRASLEIGTEALRARTILCPDAALFLDGTLRRRPPDVDCLVLARTDKEHSVQGLDHLTDGWNRTSHCADWLDERRTIRHAIVEKLRYRSAGRWAATPLFQAGVLALFDRMALERLDRGCRLLSRGRVVVTDRLHAHILSTLLGIPNVVLDNSYGKVGGFMDAWMRGNPLCHRAGSLHEVASIVHTLLETRPGQA